MLFSNERGIVVGSGDICIDCKWCGELCPVAARLDGISNGQDVSLNILVRSCPFFRENPEKTNNLYLMTSQPRQLERATCAAVC